MLHLFENDGKATHRPRGLPTESLSRCSVAVPLSPTGPSARALNVTRVSTPGRSATG